MFFRGNHSNTCSRDASVRLDIVRDIDKTKVLSIVYLIITLYVHITKYHHMSYMIYQISYITSASFKTIVFYFYKIKVNSIFLRTIL